MKYLIPAVLTIVFGCAPKKTQTESRTDLDSTIVSLDQNERAATETVCSYVKATKTPAITSPFRESSKIDLVSYSTRFDSYSNDDLIENGEFIVKNIQQRVSLNKIQRDSLFAILYNFRKAKSGIDSMNADCYDPHHSIVFYQKDQAIAFLEVCFLCDRAIHTKGINFGEFCDEKMCMIQNFFKANKVDYQLFNEKCQ